MQATTHMRAPPGPRHPEPPASLSCSLAAQQLLNNWWRAAIDMQPLGTHCDSLSELAVGAAVGSHRYVTTFTHSLTLEHER
eukprot:4578849-Alexandrium_andersonii.AAC.1